MFTLKTSQYLLGATVDGGANGIGMNVENNNVSLYPMDVTGNVGLDISNSEILGNLAQLMLTQSIAVHQERNHLPTQQALVVLVLLLCKSTTMVDARGNKTNCR